MNAVAESEALHHRVRAFARESAPAEDFESLALAIAAFQARHIPGFARLIERRGQPLNGVDSIPAVPTDAFRLTRVAVHDEDLDAVRFSTSGTTGSERGVHALRSSATYLEVALLWGRRALLRPNQRVTAVAIAPVLDDPPTSSLGFMLGAFMEHFDGRALNGATFELRERERWLLRAEGVDRAALDRARRCAESRGEPLLLLATSFALVALLDALSGERCALPPGSVVMQTGGFKGRTREVAPAELRQQVAATFELPEDAIISEYGMTELSSQLYEGTLPGGSLAGQSGVYWAPPWLRVTPVDPVTLDPMPDGEIGLARFVDLANVDSAVAIVTRDRIRRRGGGIELLGRDPGAAPRGCSLAVEALLSGSDRVESAS